MATPTTPTAEQLDRAFMRMIGRVDASNIEAKRANREDRLDDASRHNRAAMRRLHASDRLLDAATAARAAERKR